MEFKCEQCGACCRYHKCKYLVNNLCSIYETRPDRCRVEKMNTNNMPEEIYFKMVKSACNLLRIKEWIDPLINTLFDKKYEQERLNFRREE